jgi:hypothetical protein
MSCHSKILFAVAKTIKPLIRSKSGSGGLKFQIIKVRLVKFNSNLKPDPDSAQAETLKSIGLGSVFPEQYLIKHWTKHKTQG